MVGVAVKVAVDPEHIGLVPVVCAIVMDGVTDVLIFMVMLLLVAVVGLAQEALEVMTHDTTSRLANAELV